jgi:Tfp pilus assembly protein PilX
LVVTLLAVVVLGVLGTTMLTLSYSEDFNARRERNALLAFYAAEGSIHETLARLNLDPDGPSNDETELKWNAGTGNPDSVRDPRMVLGDAPDPNPANFSDSSINTWRFWNYDPSWRYSGTSTGGEGNYPGATQQFNLGLAGRAFTYNGASARTLPSGSDYTVRVVPHVRNFAGAWSFVDERGAAAAPNYYYYRLTSTGASGGQSATAQVIVRKYLFGVTVPGAVTAGGDVQLGGNASVCIGNPDDPGDLNPTSVAVQSAGTVDVTGSATVTGSEVENAAFPGFQAVFGITATEMQALAIVPSTGLQGTITYTGNETNPVEVPSVNPGASPPDYRSSGKVIWITANNGGVKKEITFTGAGPDGYVIGTASQPVILVVDGNLTLNSVTIYGVIYVTGTFRNQGGSQIRGGILVEGTAETDILGTGSDGTKICYSRRVLQKVNNNSNMFPFRALKGTWKMSRG